MKRKVPTRKNVWPFSDARTSPRNTTAASGGIAAHSKGAKTKRSKAAVTFKGYRICSSGEGFKTTPGDGTEFDTVADAKRFISDEVKMARNPAKFERCVKAVKKRGGAANAYAVCTAAGTRKKNKAKRNPADEAVKGYEDFHGRPPEEFVTVEQSVHFHRNLSGAGELIELCILPRYVRGRVIELTGFKGAILAFNEKRSQLFIKGGDQSVDLRKFGIDPDSAHERETLGEVVSVTYFTRKDHLGKKDGGTADYQHEFDKNNRPDLIYRVLEKHLEFSGGSYEILPEGIDR